MNTIVLPTYNERQNLPHALNRIREVADGRGVQLHTLIVDDDSPDGTGRLADQLAGDYPDVSALHRPARRAWAGRTWPVSATLSSRAPI